MSESKSTPKKSAKTTKKASKKSIVKKPSAMATAGKVAAPAAPVKVGATTAAASALAPPSPRAPRTGPQESDRTLFDPDYGVIGGLSQTFAERVGKAARFGTSAGGMDFGETSRAMISERFSQKRDDDGRNDSEITAWILGSETRLITSIQDPVIDFLKGQVTAKDFSNIKVRVYYCVLPKGRTSALANPQNENDWLQIRTFPRFYALEDESTQTELIAMNPCMVTIMDPVYSQFGIMRSIGQTKDSPPDWAGWGDGSRGKAAHRSANFKTLTTKATARSLDPSLAAERDKIPESVFNKLHEGGTMSWVKVPADQFTPAWNKKKKLGQTYYKLRTDVAEHYNKLYKKVKDLGGIITSAGSFRQLRTTAASRNSVALSQHAIGRAFDMAPYSCMINPDVDPYVAVRREPYVERGQIFDIWVRVTSDTVEPITLKAFYVKMAGPPRKKSLRTTHHYKEVKGKFVNFTEMARKEGFVPIPARTHTMKGYEFGGMEHWHFQWAAGLQRGKTTYLEEVLKLYKKDEIIKKVGAAGYQQYVKAKYKTSGGWW